MTRRMTILGSMFLVLGGGALAWRATRPTARPDLAARYASPLAAPTEPMSVFHLGHSLVNQTMPAMLAQLAPVGHRYNSQLGWGTTLKAHWGDDTINGFDEENTHREFRPAREAVASGDYDAIVLTEMVEIRSSIKYFDSPKYLALWVKAALEARQGVRLYLYETWHQLDDPEGWLDRLDKDLDRYWLQGVLEPALAQLPDDTRIHLIPAGQALAAFVRAVESAGGVGNVNDRTDLFRRTPEGKLDQIHLNDIGNYFVALVHATTLYQLDPVGLPHELTRADGSPADTPAPETARLMQEIVKAKVRATTLSGIST